MPNTPELPEQGAGLPWIFWNINKSKRNVKPPAFGIVDIMFRSGRTYKCKGEDIRWSALGLDSDIVAYRPAKEFNRWVFNGQKTFSQLRNLTRAIKASPEDSEKINEFAVYIRKMVIAWERVNSGARLSSIISFLEDLTGQKYYFCAAHAGEVLHENAVFHTEEDVGRFCEDGYYENFSQCHECDTYTRNRNLTNAENEEGDSVTLCRYCYREGGYRNCRSCGEHRQSSCSSSACGLDGNGRLMHSYSADVTQELPCFLKTTEEPKTKLFFGIELEVLPRNKVSQETALKICKEGFGQQAIMKPDGSLPRNGFEIVTIPATLKYHREKLWSRFFANEESNEIYDMKKKTGSMSRSVKSWATGCCGMHIHFSTEACTPMQLAKIFCFVHDAANSEFLTKIAGRLVGRESQWCRTGKRELKAKISGDKLGVPLNSVLTRARDSRTLNDKVRPLNVVDNNHYQAISYSTHTNGKTCEVRIFRGNTTKHGVMRALDFVAAMIQFCAETGGTNYIRSIGPRGGRDVVRGLSYQAFLSWFDTSQHRGAYPDLWRQLVSLKYLETKHTFKIRVAEGLLKGTLQDVNICGEVLDEGDSHVSDPSIIAHIAPVPAVSMDNAARQAEQNSITAALRERENTLRTRAEWMGSVLNGRL